MPAKKYWLMKTEPETYSIQDLERDGREDWDGIRNYQARNYMRDDMQVGDGILIYHSNAKVIGVVGLARVSRLAEPDVTARDPSSNYYDPKETKEAPRWVCVQVEHVATFPGTVSLQQLKETKGLEEMLVIRRGQRLSIQPVTKPEFDIVAALGKKAEPDPISPAKPKAKKKAATKKKAAKKKASPKKKAASKKKAAKKKAKPAKKASAKKKRKAKA